mmetsp:Transcript_11031/g.41189  ORF Transcript_11031/g.41189 Transcript_11031/m.41189 type:complete len:291 (-) Transcript_11031:175-1047(-)
MPVSFRACSLPRRLRSWQQSAGAAQVKPIHTISLNRSSERSFSKAAATSEESIPSTSRRSAVSRAWRRTSVPRWELRRLSQRSAHAPHLRDVFLGCDSSAAERSWPKGPSLSCAAPVSSKQRESRDTRTGSATSSAHTISMHKLSSRAPKSAAASFVASPVLASVSCPAGHTKEAALQAACRFHLDGTPWQLRSPVMTMHSRILRACFGPLIAATTSERWIAHSTRSLPHMTMLARASDTKCRTSCSENSFTTKAWTATNTLGRPSDFGFRLVLLPATSAGCSGPDALER